MLHTHLPDEGTESIVFLPRVTGLVCDRAGIRVCIPVNLSPKGCHGGGGMARSPGASIPPASSQPGPSRCNNTMSPWYTLPHLFSQHACEVGRGGDCPHFTEEEVEAHRGQVTCPRSQTAAKLEWALEQALRSPGAPVAGAGCEDVSNAVVADTGESSPRALSSLRAGPHPLPAPHLTLQAWAIAAQGS